MYKMKLIKQNGGSIRFKFNSI